MRLQLAVSSYSFNRFGEGPESKDRPSFAAMIDRCAELDLDGIELLGVQFDSTAPEELRALKQRAARNGVAIVAVSAHHNFVQPDPAERARQIDVVAKWVDVARELGAPFVRAFGGRWQTRRNFAEFMAASGVEPPRGLLRGRRLRMDRRGVQDCQLLRRPPGRHPRPGEPLGLHRDGGRGAADSSRGRFALAEGRPRHR
jgi:hypothetical protein